MLLFTKANNKLLPKKVYYNNNIIGIRLVLEVCSVHTLSCFVHKQNNLAGSVWCKGVTPKPWYFNVIQTCGNRKRNLVWMHTQEGPADMDSCIYDYFRMDSISLLKSFFAQTTGTG